MSPPGGPWGAGASVELHGAHPTAGPLSSLSRARPPAAAGCTAGGGRRTSAASGRWWSSSRPAGDEGSWCSGRCGGREAGRHSRPLPPVGPLLCCPATSPLTLRQAEHFFILSPWAGEAPHAAQRLPAAGAALGPAAAAGGVVGEAAAPPAAAPLALRLLAVAAGEGPASTTPCMPMMNWNTDSRKPRSAPAFCTRGVARGSRLAFT